MKKGYTHITVILDRTGSMQMIRDDTIGGFNAFLQDQQALPGEATLTLVQFDSQDPYEVIHDFRPITEVSELSEATYVPRAWTPLLDALGRGLNDLAARLDNLPEPERPEHTVFVILTDGKENASREFSRGRVVEMIKDCQEKRGWQFTFLSADLEAIEEAHTLGMPLEGMLFFRKTSDGARSAYHTASEKLGDLRAGRTPHMVYTDQDRARHERRQRGEPDPDEKPPAN